ncbi:MAG: hypothetical protein J0L64_08055 [Acidobacteria bacterium]|nr:hypothetical protein [Acidobacteriota bacterium]
MMRPLATLFVAALMAAAQTTTAVSVSYPAQHKGPFDGRLLLFLSQGEGEPREKVADDAANPALAFGIDVNAWRAGTPAVIDAKVFGWPIRSLAAIPAGTYQVQALLHKYETFALATGHTVKLPMDRGEGQQWRSAPGNLFSKPVTVRWPPKSPLRLELTEVNPPVKPVADTQYIRHIRMRSERLSKFWGRDMYLGAAVLLPHGWQENPQARYPLMIYHGHFAPTIGGFRETPPDPNLKPVYSARFRMEGYNIVQQDLSWQLYQDWISPSFPRAIVIEIQHANPYYDDSYAVNSANLGPYGDAITHELIPYIEKTFRGLGTPWSRFMYGGSTGGWEALAVQVLYPDDYNGAYGACPDPVDFRAYTTVNLYEHGNAYYVDSTVRQLRRPGKRNYLGEVQTTVEDMNHLELVLGTHSRSGGQFDIWEAVYSPMGADGYPKPIFNKLTGAIDPAVAAHWRENFDLVHILKRDWNDPAKQLGRKLAGKLNLYCGDMDNYYLNNAVYLAEEFLNTTTTPHYGGEVTYGERAEHCWNGDPTRPNGISRLRYHQMYIPKAIERMKATAPPGALAAWPH